MSLITVVTDVCAVVGVEVPTSVFSGITFNRTAQEMLALANEMAQRIAYDTREWTKLKLTASYAGDGVTTAFALPADYKRMLLTTNLWMSTSALQPMRFVPDTDEWLQRRALNRIDAWGEWTMLGGQINIWPAMGLGVTASHAYLHKNCVALSSGGFGDRFLNDNDSFALDERLLKLGMIWQWKAQKGSAYQEDLGTYSDALGYLEAADRPAPIIIGRKPLSTMARYSYPYPVPT
jgi:hypothetical protein